MVEELDIVDLLVDFDRYGNTATERCVMRMRAAEEIKRLRNALARKVSPVALTSAGDR